MTRFADVAVSVGTALGQHTDSYCTLTFLDERSVRVRVGRSPAGARPASSTVEVTDVADGNLTTYSTAAMQVELCPEPLRIRVGAPGSPPCVDVTVVDTSPSSHFGERTADAHEIHLTPNDPGARIYGCGERFDQVDQAGKVVFNESLDLLTSKYDFTYAPVPWFMSTDGYGFLHNSNRASLFDFRAERRARYEVRQFAPFDSPDVEFTLFFGPALRDVLQAYIRATGHPRLMPEWAYEPLLGPAYPRQLDRELLDEYMERIETLELPHRTFYFDGYWETYVGDLVSRKHADLKGLLDELHSRGFRVVFWTAPYVSTAAEVAPQGAEQSYFLQRMPGVGAEPDVPRVGGGTYTGWWGAYIDFTNPDAVAWHQRRLRALLEAGADGFFADFGETQDIRTATFADGSDGESAGRAYTLAYHQAVAQVCEEVRGDDYYLTARSAWTGLQQYAGLITGDQGTSYEFIPVVLAALQSAGLSGFPYVSHCLGGYWGDHAKGPFLRWVQFGVFGPLFSIWNQGSHTEPWSFDDAEVLDIYRKYARLRMELMPHIYSYAHRAATSGVPMMQALGFAFPDDADAARWEDQYVFGEEFLVAPVYSDENGREVYLPRGHHWYDYWTGSEHAGGQVVDYAAPLDVLPLFVRDGSVVASRMPDTEPLAGTLRLTFFPGERHELEVHHDGHTWTVSGHGPPENRRIVVDGDARRPLLLTLPYHGRPQEISVGGNPLAQVERIEDLESRAGWHVQPENGQVTVRYEPADGAVHIEKED
ncbi:glycoside hydrolase family 31 protein [Actinobacteria bacterium YIM 96077]|uniref:Glycoside hydrolase family 31 N-terminal domain-containing protein n=1 Tax=Phytoactinopolyspora halophila TaxID=1981511 RepID=A0A329QDL3_9ACTN|nr:TIM-barrel domain-containing protein [Phytoactinopolyspora halophila]AYY13942.1 glycoside hydrolase family 31 protein [Actinobacteria bacterium YIM 96077]RAW10071.1 hypothetical protein DPM12_19610 [Phytoactinopolyspora halophila]